MSWQNKYGPKVKGVKIQDALDALELHSRKEFVSLEAHLKRLILPKAVSASAKSSGGGGGVIDPGGGGLTVEYADLSALLVAIGTMQFDGNDGFILSQPASGVARMDFDWTKRGWYRCGSLSVDVAGTPVSYSSILSDPSVLALSCVNGAGVQVGITISNVSVTGFLATPIEAATLTWLAVPGWFPRRGVAVIKPTGTTVTLPFPFPSTSYGIYVEQCFNAIGDAIGVTINNQTTDDFLATPIETATLVYTAYKYV